MRLYIRAATQLLKKNWKSMVLFELIYRFFSTALLIWASNASMKLCLRQLGYSYLTAENYIRFITAPLTLLLILLGGIGIGLALAFEINAIFSCYESSWRKKTISVPVMIYAGVKNTGRFLMRYPKKWLFYVMASAPYLCVLYLIVEISQTKFLLYTLQQILKVIPYYKLILLLAVLVIVLSMLFSFTLPFWMMTEEHPGHVYQRIWKVAKKFWKQELMSCTLVQLLSIASVLVLFAVLMVFMVLFVMVTKSQNNQISAVLVYGSLIKYLIGVAAGAAGMVFSLLYLYTFFVRAKKQRIYRSRKLHQGAFLKLISGRRCSTVFLIVVIVLESLFAMFSLQSNLPGVTALKASAAVSAHRGGAKVAPENTLSAIAYAVEDMADYAEIDVQETKDGEIVLLHDTNLKRTTGLNANIWTLTYDEVSQLDAGVKFHKKFRGEKVPTLEEVIKYAKGKIRLNIEVKYNGHNKNIVKKVMQIIEDNGFVNECVLTSMNYKFLKQAKKINPQIKTGYTLQITYGDLEQLEYADFFSIKHTYVTKQLVDRIHELGKEVHAWTLNYQGDMQRMINCNVDNIITDQPELVRKVMLGETDRNPSFITLLKYAVK
ncbi:MAG: glycerophosphodiester phosphodiesterase [Lachnospiraceae bacterium]|nr:glycerophosphodiester phosphodiesterase [Lachnospiraceae bacterium]